MVHLFTKKVNCVLLEGIQNTDIILRWNVISLNKTSTFGGRGGGDGWLDTRLDFRLTLGSGLVETVRSPLFCRKVVEIKRFSLLSGRPS